MNNTYNNEEILSGSEKRNEGYTQAGECSWRELLVSHEKVEYVRQHPEQYFGSPKEGGKATEIKQYSV